MKKIKVETEIKPKTKVKNSKKQVKLRQYLAVTHFVDKTYENDIITIQPENTVDDVVNFKLNQYEQLIGKEDSPDPKIKGVDVFELTRIHKFYDLDALFNDEKKKFLESKEKENA